MQFIKYNGINREKIGKLFSKKEIEKSSKHKLYW